jgi:glycosyltransferase involved in cell wall biosynthesis
MKPRLTFVVQRYGEEILGGAESLARQVAERLAVDAEVQVLTTCAKEYTTWENVYPPGESVLNGVHVYRFPTVQPRRKHFGRMSACLFGQPHTLADELAWVKAQGPLSPELLQALPSHRAATDVFVFLTYIYYPTALGLRLVSDKALLVPTAHDEPPIYLNLYRALFHAPRGILFNTEEERAFVQQQFGNAYIPNLVVGLGVDAPSHPQPERFRQKLRLPAPYFLYLGRIVESKGCDELLRYFTHFRALYPGEASLVLLGKSEMSLPSTPDVIYGGFVSEAEKFDAIAGARAILVPSRFESLSMITLEAWALSRPVVTTAFSPVVCGMCRRGNGGLYYQDADEFAEILHLLMESPDLATAIGHNGRRFYQANYTWDRVLGKYWDMIECVMREDWYRV